MNDECKEKSQPYNVKEKSEKQAAYRSLIRAELYRWQNQPKRRQRKGQFYLRCHTRSARRWGRNRRTREALPHYQNRIYR